MPEQIEQYMRTLKLGGMAREWRNVEFQSTEQYVRELLELELREREVNRINRMVKTAGFQRASSHRGALPSRTISSSSRRAPFRSRPLD